MPTRAARPRRAGSWGRPAGGSSSARAGSAASRMNASKPAGLVITGHRACSDSAQYVIEGELALFVDGEQLLLGRGQAALAPRAVPHA
jgi:quercetin dioxygenase-like cupin family protein